MSEYDLDLDDENSDYDALNVKHEHETDEDTEDASETDMVKQEEEYTEIKEQMYQDKLANLKKQLQQLEDGVHPEYLKRLKKLDQSFQTRQLLNEVFERIEKERVEREYFLEKEAAKKEFEEKQIELKENLISDLEEKKRIIEAERSNMELTDKSSLQFADLAIVRRLILEDSMEVKPVTTRKLRRRPNDPLPMPEKRRKTLPTQLNFLLEDNEILDDLRILNKGKYSTPSKRHDREIRSLHRQLYLQTSPSHDGLSSDHRSTSIEVKVEDGKLFYDKKWYHRGQQVYYEEKEAGSKKSGSICTISSSEIWIRRTSDCNKVRIHINQLQKGKFTIRRRSA
ncbi:sin3 histone deacetylase corepressor complex component SDS3-like isoform X2 [Uloborus diversus]|uniref:sin3 histone deacetylase corepressor complex component SDS3-like isoform X2 n=2 Tax=Uloborus diversus TaxID=327109 RepID=UPI002409E40B|nr:sin3 histone deacetylase corepressor complex component SDS3-like isoform X2 [Uloborus diversus]